MQWGKARVHAEERNSNGSRLAVSAFFRDLKSQKRDVEKLNVPACIAPDVEYHLGYLSGYTESASTWSFFTQWNEVLLRHDGSVLPRCVIEIVIATTIGILVAIFTREELEWTPKRSDGSPIIMDEWSPVGHQIVGSLLACAPRATLCPCPVASFCPVTPPFMTPALDLYSSRT